MRGTLGQDMVTVSDPECTFTIRLYAPFAKEGPQSKMLAAVRTEHSSTCAAVYTSPDFGGWFVVGSLEAPWEPTNVLLTATHPFILDCQLNTCRTLNLPDRMAVSGLKNYKYLGNAAMRFANAALDRCAYLQSVLFIGECEYIDHIFCANKGEQGWRLECVIPAKDFTSDICELPLYVFSNFCPSVSPKWEDRTRELPDHVEIFGKDVISISTTLDPLPPPKENEEPMSPYLALPNDPFSEQYFGKEMIQIRNIPCGYAVQLYGPAAGNTPVSRWLPHKQFDIRLDMFSSDVGDFWHLITTARSKDGVPSSLGNLTGRDWHTGIGHSPNVELLLPERFRKSSFFALDSKNLPLNISFLHRIQGQNASPVCFAFQMDGKVYKDYFLEIHKSDYIWCLECIIPAHQGVTKPVPTEFVPPGYMFGSFMPLI